VGQPEDKVDLNKVHLRGKQVRRAMQEDRQNMAVSDMECMDVQGGEEEIQVALKGLILIIIPLSSFPTKYEHPLVFSVNNHTYYVSSLVLEAKLELHPQC